MKVDESKPSAIWLWFVALIIVQLVAWTGWLVIAARNPVQEIPLVSRDGK